MSAFLTGERNVVSFIRIHLVQNTWKIKHTRTTLQADSRKKWLHSDSREVIVDINFLQLKWMFGCISIFLLIFQWNSNLGLRKHCNSNIFRYYISDCSLHWECHFSLVWKVHSKTCRKSSFILFINGKAEMKKWKICVAQVTTLAWTGDIIEVSYT